ncbi:MAG: hypothetical protein WCF60_16105 [Anaerobacillus sp.]
MENKTPILLASCLILGSLLAGCGSNGAEDNTLTSNNSADYGMENDSTIETSTASEGDPNTENGNKETIDLEVGIDTALTNLNELKKTIENGNEVEKINEQGMRLDSNWDKIEAQVEEKYPVDYKNIEESLYPLIDEAKKDEPDTEKLNELIKKTIMKMTEFKKKLPTS